MSDFEIRDLIIKQVASDSRNRLIAGADYEVIYDAEKGAFMIVKKHKETINLREYCKLMGWRKKSKC